MKDLHALPKVRDSWSFLHLEQCRIDQEHKANRGLRPDGKVSKPCATLTTLMHRPHVRRDEPFVHPVVVSQSIILPTCVGVNRHK